MIKINKVTFYGAKKLKIWLRYCRCFYKAFLLILMKTIIEKATLTEKELMKELFYVKADVM